MPRRHHREPHIELPSIPPPPVPIRAQRPGPPPPHPAEVARLKREAEQREAVLMATTCCWPSCTRNVAWFSGNKLPLCFDHAWDAFIAVKNADEHRPKISEYELNRQLATRNRIAREDAERDSRAIEPGWIYYVKVTDRIKIGYSTDVRQRMRAYPPHAELLAVHPGTPTLERDIHRDFAGHLAQGREWFRPDTEVMAHVAKVLDQFGPPPKRFHYTFRSQGEAQQMKIHRSARNRRKGP